MQALNLRTIILIVTLLHITGIAFGSITLSAKSRSKPRERVLVKTIALNTQISKPQSLLPPSPKPTEKKESSKKPAPETKEKKKIEDKKKPEEVKKPPPPVDTKTRDLLAKAQQSIAKIEGGHATLSSSNSTPPKYLSQLSTDESVSPGEAGYIDEIAALLKTLLRLPERGDVEIELTLKRSGAILGTKILSAKSERNRKYIETSIGDICFPPFGKQFPGETQHKFNITLSDAK